MTHSTRTPPPLDPMLALAQSIILLAQAIDRLAASNEDQQQYEDEEYTGGFTHLSQRDPD